MTDHDHEGKVAAFGECPTCLLAERATLPAPMPNHDGQTYDPRHDRRRLNAQAQRVWDVVTDGGWHTLAEVSARTGDPEASVSARLRDFRKEQWGGHEVERRRRLGTLLEPGGTWEYRLVPNT